MDFDKFKSELSNCCEHLTEELSQLRTGRATPELVENIKVDAYGTENPIKNIATVSVADASSLVIQPWDKTLVEVLLKAVSSSNMGFSASAEGEVVRVKIPDLSQERRDEYVRLMKEKVEAARVSIRSVRQAAMKEIEAEVKEGLSEDEGDRVKADIEKEVKAMNEKVEELKEVKEKDLLSI